MPTKRAEDLRLNDQIIWPGYTSVVIAHKLVGKDYVEIMERWENRHGKLRCTPKVLKRDQEVRINLDPVNQISY